LLPIKTKGTQGLRSWLRVSACALLMAGVIQVATGVVLDAGAGSILLDLRDGTGKTNSDAGMLSIDGTLTGGAITLLNSGSDGTILLDSNPLLTGTINGFKLGEDASVLTSQPVYMTDAGLESPDGRYAITASGAAADNYVFAYETGTLTVGNPVDIPTGEGGANAISLLLEALKVCGSGVGPLDEVLCNPVFEQAPPPLVLGLVDPTGQAQ
jgi:hypothetical protein